MMKHNNVNMLTHLFTGGMDYIPGPYMITFPANRTRASLNVTVDVVECNKIFNLTVNSSSLSTPCSINIGDPSLATVTIVDHNGNHVIV